MSAPAHLPVESVLHAPASSTSNPRITAVNETSWRGGYAWYVLAVLWAVALFLFIDLQILAVLLEPV